MVKITNVEDKTALDILSFLVGQGENYNEDIAKDKFEDTFKATIKEEIEVEADKRRLPNNFDTKRYRCPTCNKGILFEGNVDDRRYSIAYKDNEFIITDYIELDRNENGYSIDDIKNLLTYISGLDGERVMESKCKQLICEFCATKKDEIEFITFDDDCCINCGSRDTEIVIEKNGTVKKCLKCNLTI